MSQNTPKHKPGPAMARFVAAIRDIAMQLTEMPDPGHDIGFVREALAKAIKHLDEADDAIVEAIGQWAVHEAQASLSGEAGMTVDYLPRDTAVLDPRLEVALEEVKP